MNNNESLNQKNNLVECDIKLIGDKSTICQIIQLLAYIRNILKNKQSKNINVIVGNNNISDFFGFSVNSQEIQDYIAKDVININ